MIDKARAIFIYQGIQFGMEKVITDLGSTVLNTSEIVDFITKQALEYLKQDTDTTVTREEVLEVWLIDVIGQLARSRGVEPMSPPVRS